MCIKGLVLLLGNSALAMTLSEVLLDVFYGISEDLESKTLSWQLTFESLPDPVRVVVGATIGLRVGHQSEDSAGRVTYASDGVNRSIGVERIILGRAPSNWVDELEGYLPIC